jgi:hypothetical protein
MPGFPVVLPKKRPRRISAEVQQGGNGTAITRLRSIAAEICGSLESFKAKPAAMPQSGYACGA